MEVKRRQQERHRVTKAELDTLERDRDEWKHLAEDYAAKLQQTEKELADEKAKNTDMLGAQQSHT